MDKDLSPARKIANGMAKYDKDRNEEVEQFLEEQGKNVEEIEEQGLRKEIIYGELKKEAEQSIRGQAIADRLNKQKDRKRHTT